MKHHDLLLSSKKNRRRAHFSVQGARLTFEGLFWQPVEAAFKAIYSALNCWRPLKELLFKQDCAANCWQPSGDALKANDSAPNCWRQRKCAKLCSTG